jgi:hypothetical protein
MEFGGRTNLIMYLHPWSESMTLAPRTLGFLPVSPKPSSLSSSKIEREILGLGETLFWELVPGVVVTLVSKFHSIWSNIAQESSFGRNGWILERKNSSRDLLPDFV